MDSAQTTRRRQHSNAGRYFTVLMLVAAGLGGTLAYFRVWTERRHNSAPSPASARSHVAKYLRALQAYDKGAVVRLAPPGYAPDVDAAVRIERFGGASAEKARIDVTTDLAPDHASVVINTVGPDGHQLVWHENLFWEGGAWWLVLGGHASAVATSETRRWDANN